MDFANYWFSATGSGADLGQDVSRSLRFRGAQNLKRTLGTPTNQNNWTVSLWIKNAKIGSRGDFFDSSNVNPPSDSNLFEMFFNGDGTLAVGKLSSSNSSTARFRDPAAWYHIVITNDGTDIEVYVNGDLVNTWSGQGGATAINTASQHCIGSENFHNGDGLFTEGYMAEFNFLDGTHLTPTSFGRTNNDGVWVPKDLSSLTSDQYGNNGFRLQFQDATNLGDDTAPTGGNHDSANDFTPSGFDTTAISSSNEDNDLIDDEPNENFAVITPILGRSSSFNFEHGNLRVQYGAGGSHCGMATFGAPANSGKWYWEVTLKEQKEGGIGIVSEDFDLENGNNSFGMDSSGTGWEWIVSEGRRDNNGETANSHTIPNVGDTIGFLLDTTAGECTIEINGVAQTANNGAKFTNIPTDKTIYPYFRLGGASGDANLDWNFGQFAFQHEPTGYKKLSTANLPEPSIKNGSDHFRALTGTGANILGIAQGTNTNGTNWNSDVNTGFTSGLWLIKDRANNSTQFQFVDSVRGSNLALTCPSLGGDTAYSAPSGNSVAFCWNYDSSSPSTNGFQIVTYEGNATVGRTVSHSLGAAPDFIITKERDANDNNWVYYHSGVGVGYGYLMLDGTAYQHDSGSPVMHTATSNTTWTLNDNGQVNGSGTDYVSYAWTSVEGFSKFGTFSGDNGGGSNPNYKGAFVELGFRPALLMIKRHGAGGDPWIILDSTRDTHNFAFHALQFSSSNAEISSGDQFAIDFLSNGFKCRSSNAAINLDSGNYHYCAWAENPFGGEDTPPVTAR